MYIDIYIYMMYIYMMYIYIYIHCFVCLQQVLTTAWLWKGYGRGYFIYQVGTTDWGWRMGKKPSKFVGNCEYFIVLRVAHYISNMGDKILNGVASIPDGAWMKASSGHYVAITSCRPFLICWIVGACFH